MIYIGKQPDEIISLTWNDIDFDKKRIAVDIISKRFRELLIDINVKVRKLYNLRHTFASTMITQGQNILWVSKMLGHKVKVYAN